MGTEISKLQAKICQARFVMITELPYLMKLSSKGTSAYFVRIVAEFSLKIRNLSSSGKR